MWTYSAVCGTPANHDNVTFHLMASYANSQASSIQAFPRKIVGDAWKPPVPSVTRHENGAGTRTLTAYFFLGGTVRVNSIALASQASTPASSAATSGGMTT